MYFILIFLSVLFILFLLCLYLISPSRSSFSMRAPFLGRNFAHRGLHSKEKHIPENSIPAFDAAVNAGYGIELDIQLTKDGQLVVFHDDTLTRVCGFKKRIDELTYQELQEYPLFDSPEHIPLFSEVLSLIRGQVPLIVELKNGKQNGVLCTQALLLLRSYQGPFCIESFHPFIVGWFRKYAPDILRGQLSGPASEFSKVLSPFLRFGLSRLLSNFYARPHFIAYRKGKRPWLVCLCTFLGALRFVWTVRPGDNIEQLEQTNDALIFESYTPKPKFRS